MAPHTPRQAAIPADSLATGRELVAAVQQHPGLFEAHRLLVMYQDPQLLQRNLCLKLLRKF